MRRNNINQLHAGVVLSYINLGISSIIPMLYTPIMLRMLGQSEYGLYSLANSVIGYLSLLSFGFGSTIIRYISKYRAQNDKEKVDSIVGLFLAIYCLMGFVVLIVGTTLSFYVEPIFHKGLLLDEIQKIHKLILIMTFNTAISFPMSVFSAIITSYERYIFRRLIDMMTTVAAPILNLIALYLGFASVGMALASTVLQIVMIPVNIGYCFHVLKIRPRLKKYKYEFIRELLSFSLYIFIGTIVDMLFWSTDKVVLGMLASSVAVAIYNVGGTFNNIVINLSTSVSSVLTPRITGMVVKNTSKDKLTELFIRVGRLQYVVIALIVSGFAVFGQTFIYLWAGSDYADAYWISILTMFPLCIPLIQNTGLSIVIAQNQHKFRSIVYLIVAIINVVTTYLLVPVWGVIGAAFCSCISYIIGQGFIMNIYYYKVTGINIPLFWKNIVRMSYVPCAMLLAGIIANKYTSLNNWGDFFTAVLVYTVIYCVSMYFGSLNQYEKDLIKKPISYVVKKIKKGKAEIYD